jgi:hypothetical protein
MTPTQPPTQPWPAQRISAGQSHRHHVLRIRLTLDPLGPLSRSARLALIERQLGSLMA